jgi:hypothetical protein
VGRKKLLPPPPSDPPSRPPWRTVISLNKVESVTRGSSGGLIISGRTGGREIAVEVPKSEINALLAGSRWPLAGPKMTEPPDVPDDQLSLF